MKELLNKFVKRPLDFVDSGELFKKGFFLIFKLLALLTVGFGLYTIITQLGPYFGNVTRGDVFFIIRSIIVFILTLITSLACFIGLGLIFWKNGDDFKETPYNGLALIVAKILKITGQLLALVYGIIGTNIFISVLFAGAPFGISITSIKGLIPKNPLMAFMGAAYYSETAGQYFNNLLGGLIAFAISIVAMFVILAVFYLLAELWEILLSFLLRKKVFKD